MKILVPVKQSAILESDFEVSENEIKEKYLDHQLNESDEYALEEALKLSENSSENIEVVAATIGPARATETANYALAMGVDRAIRIWDEALGDISFLNPKTKAEILAALSRKEDPDLILAGVQSDDALYGATGIYLANELGFGWAAAITDFELNETDMIATIQRELEGGLAEEIQVDLPSVFTLQSGINDPRYVSLRTVFQSNQSPTEMSLSQLGIDVGKLENSFPVVELEQPETHTEFFDGDSDEVGHQLLNLLQERGVTK